MKRKLRPVTLALAPDNGRSIARLAGAMALARLPLDERERLRNEAWRVLDNLRSGGSSR